MISNTSNAPTATTTATTSAQAIEAQAATEDGAGANLEAKAILDQVIEKFRVLKGLLREGD